MVKITSLFLKANINTYLHEIFLAHELSASHGLCEQQQMASGNRHSNVLM